MVLILIRLINAYYFNYFNKLNIEADIKYSELYSIQKYKSQASFRLCLRFLERMRFLSPPDNILISAVDLI